MELVNENKPVKYRAVLMRAHCRELYITSMQIPTYTRTQQRWLMALDSELYDAAQVETNDIGEVTAEAFKNPEEAVELEFSKDGALGVKHALVSALKGYQNGQQPTPPANIARRKYLLSIAAAFGKKFLDLVETGGKLPENDEEEKADLDLSEKVSG